MGRYEEENIWNMPTITNMGVFICVYIYISVNKKKLEEILSTSFVTSNSLKVLIGQGFAKMLKLCQLNAVRVFCKFSGGNHGDR